MSGPLFLGMPPAAPRGTGHLRGDDPFPAAARRSLDDSQLRANLRRATATIRSRRARVVAELPDWEELRAAGEAAKSAAMARLDEHLERLEAQVTAHGGTVHWARDAAEANAIVTRLVKDAGAAEAVKVKSLATDEIGLNDALAAAGITGRETDLAELIVQLGGDRPSHILVPAIHRNRSEIREIFLREMSGADPGLTDDPAALAEAARLYLRRKFLSAKVGISGANFAIAETGTVCVVESEGNGRMCLTLPDTLITVLGIEKVLPAWTDLGVFLQLLPRSSTGERMNPYTTMWTGVTPGDGPQAFHLVLLDNGRSAVLASAAGRAALHCIRCSACLNVCPVYERAGGHAYGSVYPGPIGAILSPQLTGVQDNSSLPYASTLCGACYEACPVKIDIPAILVDLRARHVEEARREHKIPGPEAITMAAASWVMTGPRRYRAAQRAARLGKLLGRHGTIRRLPPPLSAWTSARDAPVPPAMTFRDWWRHRQVPEVPPPGRPAAGDPLALRAPAPPATAPELTAPRASAPHKSAPHEIMPQGTAPDAAPPAGAGPAGISPASAPRLAGAAAARADGLAGPARGEVLERIRRANAMARAGRTVPGGTAAGSATAAQCTRPASEAQIPGYRTAGQRDTGELLGLLAGRLADYRATVRRTTRAGLAAEVAAALREQGARRLVVPAGLDPAILSAAQAEIVMDHAAPGGAEAGSLSAAALDALDGAVTGAAVAIAETGTIVLDASPGQGRRASTLVPDYHLCVVHASQVVELVPEAVARLADAATRPLTWISGPSATSDIELERVEGVHGPRHLAVILVEDA